MLGLCLNPASKRNLSQPSSSSAFFKNIIHLLALCIAIPSTDIILFMSVWQVLVFLVSFNNLDHLRTIGSQIIQVEHSQYHFIKELELVSQLPSIDITMTAVSIWAQQLVWSWLTVTSTPIIQRAVIAVGVMAWQGCVHVNIKKIAPK